MPQVDLETLVSACAGGACDRKIACETLATATSDNHQPPELEEVPPDFPPESFWLSKDAELDWFDRNAFLDRKDSGKGNSNSTNLNPNIQPNPSNSQRFSNLKSKASIIGLPKPQKTCYVDSKNRRNGKPANTRLFPKRSSSTNVKSDSSLVEPSSPKVSCMGRVRSKRDRNRRLRNRQRSKRSTEPEIKKEKKERRRSGFFASFKGMFRHNHKQRQQAENDKSYKQVTAKTSDIRERLPVSDRDALPRMSVDIEPVAGEPAGLGGMKRFSSGRRSESWGVDVRAA